MCVCVMHPSLLLFTLHLSPFVCLSFYFLSVSLSVSICISLCVCFFVYLFLYACLTVCSSVCLSLYISLCVCVLPLILPLSSLSPSTGCVDGRSPRHWQDTAGKGCGDRVWHNILQCLFVHAHLKVSWRV